MAAARERLADFAAMKDVWQQGALGPCVYAWVDVLRAIVALLTEDDDDGDDAAVDAAYALGMASGAIEGNGFAELNLGGVLQLTCGFQLESHMRLLDLLSEALHGRRDVHSAEAIVKVCQACVRACVRA